MAPMSTTFQKCGPAKVKDCSMQEQQKVERGIIAKDTNCNVSGIQPCCSMFQNALFDDFTHQCLVLLIEKQQKIP